MRYLFVILLGLLLEQPNLGDAATVERKDIAYGILALLAGDTIQHPFRNLAENDCWTNPNVTGVVLRTNWAKVEPAEGNYNWGFLDQGLALARQHHKLVSITVVAGAAARSPDWIFNKGAKPFMVTGQGPMPAPWDPVFRQSWSTFVQALAARYDESPLVAYVTMGGPGRGEELYLTHTPIDVDELNSAGGIENWIKAVNSVTDTYAAAFKYTPFIYALGAPVPQPAGGQAMRAIINYGVSNYPGRFGIKHDGLAPNYLMSPARQRLNPGALRFPYETKSFAASEIPALSAKCPVGFQMLAASGSGRRMEAGSLQFALDIGLKLRAHFIEVYGADCRDPSEQSTIADANRQLLARRSSR
jgi:Beta-galactosidase